LGRNGVADVVAATVALMIVGSFHGVDEREAPAMAGVERMTIEEVVR
jgi:hypothetical protein